MNGSDHPTAGSVTGSPGPFSRLLGFRLVETTRERAVIEASPAAEHLNGGGIVHGGYLSALLDSATGWAVLPHLPDGHAAPHVHLSVQYVRAAVGGTPLVCTARCVRAGRGTAAAEAEITQGDAVVARAVTSHAVIPLR